MFRKQVEFNKSIVGSKPVKLKKGQAVIIKRETGLSKGKSRYHSKGMIYDVLGIDTYNVLVKGALYKRHFDQIKILDQWDYFPPENINGIISPQKIFIVLTFPQKIVIELLILSKKNKKNLIEFISLEDYL